jgi:Amt family ammonium transporter
MASIALNTNLAAAAGAVAAMFTAWVRFRAPDPGMSLNGALAGLVGITAPCANVTPLSSVVIGLVAGVLVVFAISFIEHRLRVDDPVGAISVHGVCGAWGTLAAGLFNAEGVTLAGVGVQTLGVVACFAWAFTMAFIMFKVISATVGLRVPPEEEMRGLDIGEHRTSAYPEFQMTVPR